MGSEGRGKGPRILFTEDRIAHAHELVGALSDEGYVAELAETAEDAIMALRSTGYAAMLLDVQLPLGESEKPEMPDGVHPDRVGIELLRHLRAIPELSLVPVIVISGLDYRTFWDGMVRELQGDELHAISVIPKPAGPREVIRELARITGWQGPLFRAFKADDPSYGE